MKLEQMHSLSINILNQLGQLKEMVEENEIELMRLNNIPDEEYTKFRFISDYLSEFSKTFDDIRDYGI
jgi:DNA repair protein RadC